MEKNSSGFIDECKRLNELALKELYEQYNGSLMAVCMRYTANYDEAQDLLQEGFIKIIKNIHAFNSREISSLEGFLTRL